MDLAPNGTIVAHLRGSGEGSELNTDAIPKVARG